MQRIMVAMSGGIDSAAAAILLMEQGCEVEGVTFLLFDGSDAPQRAARVCATIGVPHHIVDFRAEFDRHVVSTFASGYKRGITPNPCVECNRQIKFGAFFDWAMRQGAHAVATGHYARIGEYGGRLRIMRAADAKKDQSYVLYTLPGSKLPYIRLPLGGITKDDARRILLARGVVVEAGESQDICFIPDGDYTAFLGRMDVLGRKGDIIDLSGRAIGRHRGIIYYTVGQRKGLGLATPEPVYVHSINAAANTVCVAGKESLHSSRLVAGSVCTAYHDDLVASERVTAKIRYGHDGQTATARRTQMGFEVIFDHPQRAVTPGQSVVLYIGDALIGGGVIELEGGCDE